MLQSSRFAKWFHQLRIKNYPDGVLNSRGEEIRGSDIHKTAFRTQYGTFEYVVMPFSLVGAPSTYQRFVSSILNPILNPKNIEQSFQSIFEPNFEPKKLNP